MTKIDLMLISGITASDGSLVASGATLKFDAEFFAGNTNIKVMPRLYRNRELFVSGFTHTQISEEIIPYDFILEVPDEEFYSLTPYDLYQKVGDYLNVKLNGNFFELKIINE